MHAAANAAMTHGGVAGTVVGMELITGSLFRGVRCRAVGDPAAPRGAARATDTA